MEKKIEQNNKVTNEKTKFTLWRILTYFIIYSILGFVVETLFGLVTKGVIESRQSFLYGPFCAIYGVGAVVMLYFLQYFKKNKYTLFLGGFLIGSVVEYLISLIGEYIFNVKWWDYSDMAFNINGRICIAFSFIWGLLAIYLVCHINIKVDRIIEKLKSKFSIKTLKSIVLVVILFMCLDYIVSTFAMKMFFARFVCENNIDIYEKEKYIEEYEYFYSNEIISQIARKYFSDEKMLKTFPNLKYTDSSGKTRVIDEILKGIKPYYYKVFEIKDNKIIWPLKTNS